jgi:hypothetical protein
MWILWRLQIFKKALGVQNSKDQRSGLRRKQNKGFNDNALEILAQNRWTMNT